MLCVWRVHVSSRDTHQIDSNASPDEEATIHIHGMVFELDDASQTTDDCTHDEGKDQ